MSETEKFISAIFAPSDLVEIRPLPAEWERAWCRAGEIDGIIEDAHDANRRGANIYFGVLPRDRDGGGTAEDVTAGRAAWVDFDGIKPEAVDLRGLPEPTVIIDSGHGTHIYWCFDSLIPKADLVNLVADLAAYLGSDPSVADAARVMRLPGFVNHKPPVANAKIYTCRNTLAGFFNFRECVPARQSAPQKKSPTQSLIIGDMLKNDDLDYIRRYLMRMDGSDEGGRNQAAFRAAAFLVRDKALPSDAAIKLLREFNEAKLTPPLEEEELVGLVANAAKHGKQPVGAKVEPPAPIDDMDYDAFIANCRSKKIIAPALEPEPETRFVDILPCRTNPPDLPEAIIEDVMGRGNKFAIIGPSKSRKTFFSLQLAACLAGGFAFLGLPIVRPQRVGIVQLEIGQPYYEHRYYNMANSLARLGCDMPEGAYLRVMHARGLDVRLGEIVQEVFRARLDVVIFDPLYKLHSGDENDARDMKFVFGLFDQLARAGVAVVYVHHDRKGGTEQASIDRGAGSGVAARDYDGAFILTPSDTSDCLVQVEMILRNYAPRNAFEAIWAGGCFITGEVIRPGRKKKSWGALELADAIMDKKYEVMTKTPFAAQVDKDFPDASRPVKRDAIRILLETGRLIEERVEGSNCLKNIKMGENQ